MKKYSNLGINDTNVIYPIKNLTIKLLLMPIQKSVLALMAQKGISKIGYHVGLQLIKIQNDINATDAI